MDEELTKERKLEIQNKKIAEDSAKLMDMKEKLLANFKPEVLKQWLPYYVGGFFLGIMIIIAAKVLLRLVLK